MKKIVALGMVFMIVASMLGGCGEKDVVSGKMPVPKPTTSLPAPTINPETREKTELSRISYNVDTKKYEVVLYGMKSKDEASAYSDFMVQLRDENGFLVFDKMLDLGEKFTGKCFKMSREDMDESICWVNNFSENKKKKSLIIVDLVDSASEQKYTRCFAVSDCCIEYFDIVKKDTAKMEQMGICYLASMGKVGAMVDLAAKQIKLTDITNQSNKM